MAEYSSLKVPELKKLLAEKGLPQTGNKADLIARLVEEDKKNDALVEKAPAATKDDEINYSDDEAPTAKPAAPKEAAQAAAPAAAAKPAATTDEPAKADAAPTEEPAPAEPAQSFALGLSSTAAGDEAKKRADRAKRFGIEEDDADVAKRAERAKRFGIDEKDLASGLDAALPERPLKRGRDRGEGGGGGGDRPGKRQSLDRRGGQQRGRGGRGEGRGRVDGANGAGGGGGRKGGILDDPTEKAKAEKRAARFAAA